jgi:archaellum biogenesis ATPase FlaH
MFFKIDWETQFGLFEVYETSWQTLVRNDKNIIAYVNNESFHMSTMLIVFKLVVFHLTMACQNATIGKKACKGLKYVSIKSSHAHLQKYITHPKNL